MWGGEREREREREREGVEAERKGESEMEGRAQAHVEYVTGMARGQLTFIILTLMDYLIPYIPSDPSPASSPPLPSPDTLLSPHQSTG